MKHFNELGIAEPLLKAIEEEGFDKPTEIQEKSIPIILQGKDIIAGSKTGSGKTLAFASAIIQNVEKGRGIQAIVLTPTRELAVQVTAEMEKFSKYKKLGISSVYGGVGIGQQIESIKHSEVIIGTPGRVLDHLSRDTLDLSRIRILVLDEADRMLDMGFIDDVRQILGQCPKERQTLLFSATISSDIYDIAQEYMNNPVKVAVESNVDPAKLLQSYYQVPMNLKFSLLVHLLKSESTGLVMVFCNTQRITDYIAKNLKKQGIDAVAIHGGLSQAKRDRTMETFHSGKAYVLVCTDVAARGLHIEDVSHVYNYDIPKESKQYIHRIGRTARAGKFGKAINILSEMDYENFDNILRDFQIDIKQEETPRLERLYVETMNPRGRRFSNDRRHSSDRRFSNDRGPSNFRRR